jgi:hypothetical protein
MKLLMLKKVRERSWFNSKFKTSKWKRLLFLSVRNKEIVKTRYNVFKTGYRRWE